MATNNSLNNTCSNSFSITGGDLTVSRSQTGGLVQAIVQNTNNGVNSGSRLNLSGNGIVNSGADFYIHYDPGAGSGTAFQAGNNTTTNAWEIHSGVNAATAAMSGTKIFQAAQDGQVTIPGGNLAVQRSLPGGLVRITCANTDTSNSSSNSNFELTTLSGGGDPYFGSVISPGFDWIWGQSHVDNSWKLGHGGPPSAMAGVCINVTTGGAITKPQQPRFIAQLSAPTTNDVTGDGTQYKILFDQVPVNIGSAYNAATGLFTAPEEGVYQFSYGCMFNNLGAGHTGGSIQLNFNGMGSGVQGSTYINTAAIRTPTNQCTTNNSILANLLAGDTVEVDVIVENSTKTVGIEGESSGKYTYFMGCLLA